MRGIEHTIEHSTQINASAETVWQHITEVDIASFRHPAYFSLLGIPKPLRAHLDEPGVGGARIAYFSNKRHFSQEITEWQPFERYAFTFQADPGFRVAYVLDLADGPFQMKAGAIALRRPTMGCNCLSPAATNFTASPGCVFAFRCGWF